jgi:hypothetical protein
MKKIIITETQLKNLIKRRSLNESPILYPLPTDANVISFEDLRAAGINPEDVYNRLKSRQDSDNKLKNPEADEIDFEDLQATGDMYDRLKSGEDSDNKLNVDVVGGKFVDPKGMESDMEEYGTEETFENTDFGLNLNEGQIKLRKTFNKFMKNPIIKNLEDTL